MWPLLKDLRSFEIRLNSNRTSRFDIRFESDVPIRKFRIGHTCRVPSYHKLRSLTVQQKSINLYAVCSWDLCLQLHFTCSCTAVTRYTHASAVICFQYKPQTVPPTGLILLRADYYWHETQSVQDQRWNVDMGQTQLTYAVLSFWLWKIESWFCYTYITCVLHFWLWHFDSDFAL